MGPKETLYKKIKIGDNIKKNKTIKKLNCSPAVKGKTVKADSCLLPSNLIKIKDAYNKDHQSSPIKSTNPSDIWDQLKNRLSCKTELCWIDQISDPGLKRQIKEFQFAPKKPDDWKGSKEQDKWVSNFDIMAVLRQYEKVYPEFVLIEPTTMDFDSRPKEKGGECVLPDLCNFSLENWIKKKKTKIAISINLAYFYQGGEHWVSLFVDIENRLIFFFDSGGDPPVKQIQVLIDRIVSQGSQLKSPIRFKVVDNRGNQHQNMDTECGMYSMFFFITMLTGKITDKNGNEKPMSLQGRIHLFKDKKIPDKTMIYHRNLYFND
jgi:hypothetical protein